METTTIVLFGGAMFVLGMYVTTQISEWIESRRRQKELMNNLEQFDDRKYKFARKKSKLEEPYIVPADEWDDVTED